MPLWLGRALEKLVMSLVIGWKGKKQTIHFDHEFERYADDWINYVSLQDVLTKLTGASGVPQERIKLLFNGGNSAVQSCMPNRAHTLVMMKDPKAMLSSFGIKTGSKIMMIGDRAVFCPDTAKSSTNNFK